MSYICQYIQWNKADSSDEKSWVPAPPKSDDPNNQAAYKPIVCDQSQKIPPIFLVLLGPDGDTDFWDLQFVSCFGMFYKKSSVIDNTIPTHDGDIINAWYIKRGPNGHHYLALTPFISNEEGTEGFLKTTKPFVDFTVPPTVAGGSVVNTDTMQAQEVTATVHSSLPEFDKSDFKSHASSTAVFTEVYLTKAIFDQIFVYSGIDQPQGDKITVEKNTSCLALAIFRKSTVKTGGFEISTAQYPKIHKWEWPEIISEIIQETFESGEVIEYLNPKKIEEMKPDVIKKAVVSINKKMATLQKLKSVISVYERER